MKFKFNLCKCILLIIILGLLIGFYIHNHNVERMGDMNPGLDGEYIFFTQLYEPGVHHKQFCSDNWAADWKKRTINTLDVCKAKCSKDTPCNGVVFGNFAGIKNRCVLCTGKKIKMGNAKWSTLYIKNQTGGVPFYKPNFIIYALNKDTTNKKKSYYKFTRDPTTDEPTKQGDVTHFNAWLPKVRTITNWKNYRIFPSNDNKKKILYEKLTNKWLILSFDGVTISGTSPVSSERTLLPSASLGEPWTLPQHKSFITRLESNKCMVITTANVINTYELFLSITDKFFYVVEKTKDAPNNQTPLKYIIKITSSPFKDLTDSNATLLIFEEDGGYNVICIFRNVKGDVVGYVLKKVKTLAHSTTTEIPIIPKNNLSQFSQKNMRKIRDIHYDKDKSSISILQGPPAPAAAAAAVPDPAAPVPAAATAAKN